MFVVFKIKNKKEYYQRPVNKRHVYHKTQQFIKYQNSVSFTGKHINID